MSSSVHAYRLVHKRHQLRPGCLEQEDREGVRAQPCCRCRLLALLSMQAFSLVVDSTTELEASERPYHG